MLTTNILLALVLTVNVFFLLFCALFSTRLYRFYNQFKVFISPKADNETSPLADSVQIVADMIGRSITASLKATFMGKISSDQRAQSAIEGDIAEDTLKNQGTIGSLLTSFPTLRKTLRRNPQLIDMALQMISKANNGSKSNTGASSQVKFNL